MKESFSYVVNAQLYGMLASLLVFALAARWYWIPRLRQLPARTALTLLLWIQVPRYVTLIQFSAQREGYPISNVAVMEAVVGDVAGAMLALLSLAVLRRMPKTGIVFSWLLVAETIADMAVGVVRKIREPLWGLAGGVTWLILDVYIPMIVVSLVVLISLLLSKRTYVM